MTRRAPKPLPSPTQAERDAARLAAAAMRRAIAEPETLGPPSTMHVDYSRPRRAEWVTTWASVPGLSRVNGAYQHSCLPGWRYERAEIVSEMIPDLEALAERGVRPAEVTS